MPSSNAAPAVVHILTALACVVALVTLCVRGVPRVRPPFVLAAVGLAAVTSSAHAVAAAPAFVPEMAPLGAVAEQVASAVSAAIALWFSVYLSVFSALRVATTEGVKDEPHAHAAPAAPVPAADDPTMSEAMRNLEDAVARIDKVGVALGEYRLNGQK